MTKVEWMIKNGFNESGIIYCITGNTYSIKDKLKELGCRYNPTLKWYSDSKLELPDDFPIVSFNFDDIYSWDEKYGKCYMREDAKVRVDKAVYEAKGPSKSQFMGSVGERLRNITAIYASAHSFQGPYGFSYIYTFTVGENVLVWFTQKELEIEAGTPVDLTGTVKKFDVYRGVNTTQLSRCVVKEIK